MPNAAAMGLAALPERQPHFYTFLVRLDLPSARVSTRLTYRPTPGSSDPRGPATLSVRIRCWRMNRRRRTAAASTSTSCALNRRQGLPCSRENRTVFAVPPFSRPVTVKITVPSESRTFHSVRWAKEALGVSCRPNRKGITPPSRFRPHGHHPPCGMPCRTANLSAAVSAPDCPPLRILTTVWVTGE
jgi:hypothetical protein